MTHNLKTGITYITYITLINNFVSISTNNHFTIEQFELKVKYFIIIKSAAHILLLIYSKLFYD